MMQSESSPPSGNQVIAPLGDFRTLPPCGFHTIYAKFQVEEISMQGMKSEEEILLLQEIAMQEDTCGAAAKEGKQDGQDDESRSEASTRASQDNSSASEDSRCPETSRSEQACCRYEFKEISFSAVDSACAFLESGASQGHYDMKCFGLLMGDTGVGRITAALKANTNVKSLDLSCNRIGPSGAKGIADVLRSNTTLTSLNLRGNCLSCSGAQAIAEGLECNTTLKSLNLGGNGIGSMGSDRLAQAIRTNDTLHDVVLSSNGLGPSAAQKLIEAAKDGSVEKMDMRGLNVNGAGAEAALLSNAALALESKRRCMVLTVDLLPSGDISCTTLAGNQVAAVASTATLSGLAKAAAAATGIPEEKLKFIRPDGITICDPQDKETLFKLSSCQCEDMPKAAPRHFVHRDWGDLRYRDLAPTSDTARIVERMKLWKVKEDASSTQTSTRHAAKPGVPPSVGVVASTPLTISEGGFLGCLRSACGQKLAF